jgi:hypothetical protein
MNLLKKNINFYIIIFVIIGFGLRIVVSNYGYNHDFLMHQKNMELLKNGESFYGYGKYNYSPLWVNLLLFLDSISLSFIDYQPVFRLKIILLLSLVDFLIFFLLCKNYSTKIGLLFFLNPISIFITGFHNQFDNISILLAFVAILIYEKYKSNYQFLISLIILGISICAKQIFFFFPVWLAIKEKKIYKKILIIFIPYFLFLISFKNYFPTELNYILENVFQYKSYNNGPFWGMFTPKIIYMYVDKKILFFISMILLGFLFENKNLREVFYFYLITIVVFSSAIVNQYLAIPLLTMAIYWNNKYLLYSILSCLLFLVDGDALNINFLRDFFEWNLRSTRIVYYPIILLLLFGFLETIFGKKKLNSFFSKIIKLIVYKIKAQLLIK